MDTATKMVERTEMIWAALLVSGFSIKSHIIFWYLANFPVPKSSSSSCKQTFYLEFHMIMLETDSAPEPRITFSNFVIVSSISSTTKSLLVKNLSLKRVYAEAIL